MAPRRQRRLSSAPARGRAARTGRTARADNFCTRRGLPRRSRSRASGITLDHPAAHGGSRSQRAAHTREQPMTIKIHAQRQRQSAGQAGRGRAAFQRRPARRAQADWLHHLGSARPGQRPERHVSRAQLRRQRRAPLVRAAAADYRQHGRRTSCGSRFSRRFSEFEERVAIASLGTPCQGGPAVRRDRVAATGSRAGAARSPARAWAAASTLRGGSCRTPTRRTRASCRRR